MTDQGKVNYEAYRKLAGRPGVSAAPLPEYEQLPMELAYAFDAGADAVEAWLAELPVDEDMPGGEPGPRYALVEQMGYRSVTGTVRETEFCGRPMLEVTDMETGHVRLVGGESLYQVTWLTRDQAERATRTGSHAVAAISAAPLPSPWGDDERDAMQDDDGDDGSGPASQLHEGDWDDAVSEATL